MRYTKPELRSLNSPNRATGQCINGSSASFGVLGCTSGTGFSALPLCADGSGNDVWPECVVGGGNVLGACTMGTGVSGACAMGPAF